MMISRKNLKNTFEIEVHKYISITCETINIMKSRTLKSTIRFVCRYLSYTKITQLELIHGNLERYLGESNMFTQLY